MRSRYLSRVPVARPEHLACRRLMVTRVASQGSEEAVMDRSVLRRRATRLPEVYVNIL